MTPEILSAFRSSSCYYVTQSGKLIPLTAILSAEFIGPKKLPQDIMATTNGRRIAAINSSIEEGSLEVTIVGGSAAPMILPPQEIPAFITALRTLSATVR